MHPSNPFSTLIGHSPFSALQEHMRAVLVCTREVVPLFEALVAGDEPSVQAIAARLCAQETAGERLKNSLRSHLPRTLFLPVDRRDLLEVLQMQDALAAGAEAIAGIVSARRMEVPAPLGGLLMELVQTVTESCERAGGVIEELDELLEIGFRGRGARQVEAMVETVCQSRGDAERLGQDLVRGLFEHEDSMPPVAVVMWYELIGRIRALADSAAEVGNRVRLLVST